MTRPLTTGEGNTPGRIVVEGDVHKVEPTRQYFAELRASLKNALDVQRDMEAECGRLREQLDAARQALAEIAQRAEYFAQSAPRHPQNAAILASLARAALGVEGEQEKPT